MATHRTVFVCQGTGCVSGGGDAVYEALKAEVERHKVAGVEVDFTGCHGFCEQGPNVVIEPEGIFYTRVQPEDAAEIVASHFRDNKPVERLFYCDPVTGQRIPYYAEINFYKKQQRVILRNCGRINPEKIDHYIEAGGYRALRKVLLMKPEEVIEEIKKSGLRGRGGAGFPTGRKWEFCRASPGSIKYVICNADEGDPGAFMDRSILEADPHAVIEGLAIAGYAIGAREGYIYVRAEYPLAVKRFRIALEQAQQRGFLGIGILGSNFSFVIHVKEGAGAFVCGEETALIASIESKRGMPRPRPPFPAQSGLDGKPSNINNVKTLASVSVIIDKGAEWFASLGTEKSKGTAVFALTGKIANSGLVEVPMGTPLSTVIFDIGGGIPRGKRFKAVQTGGPSGGCISTRFIDTPVDYDSLAQLGSIMGSGGMVVMDEATCMVEVARYFLSFTQDESCGKCVPCRLGTRQMLEILTRITQGKGQDSDIATLLSIAKTVKESSLCGLGQTCPNPVLTTINYFRDEYETHIKEKRCPAAVCDSLMISPCQHTCPVGINIPKYVAHIASGEPLESVETIRERNPFPAICGRICHHPCEGRCRRGELDEPVAIRSLKRFASDWYFDNISKLPPPEPFPRTRPQKVAVIGAGPTGLSCAYYLAQMGYGVTVFEALPVGGGMLSVAIPDFRLPRKVIEQEIEYIARRGVDIRYNTPIGANLTVDDLKKDGFAAVFVAAGAQRSQRVGIPGELEDVEGFHYGLRFLRDVKVGKQVRVGKKVAVIGGGNVALDAARTSLRLGADEVSIFYRRSREEMPVTEVEYEEAVTEGIQISFLVSPTRIVNDNWKVTGLQCIRMQLGEMDASGRRRPLPIPGSEFFAEADTVIAAVGQAPDLSFLPPDSALERTRWETLAVDSNTLATNVPGVFAGGDFVTGPGMVIEAIAAGRRGALAIDKYLKADTSRVEMYDMKTEVILEAATKPEEEAWESQKRLEVPRLPTEERKSGFEEIELSFSEEIAVQEAKRCLRCDLER
ncbi:MAG: FAD-dependent oxidoreductase [Chloroflexi bacterium]|nr:FAD-dependent oxidoreductase [Chloroflexota bacterium]MBM4449304.1 FAD-dependent oxidoreductase [Chloroflexota bacterium]